VRLPATDMVNIVTTTTMAPTILSPRAVAMQQDDHP
jgi:hypothetical protein